MPNHFDSAASMSKSKIVISYGRSSYDAIAGRIRESKTHRQLAIVHPRCIHSGAVVRRNDVKPDEQATRDA
jgi:hypothetical protein